MFRLPGSTLFALATLAAVLGGPAAFPLGQVPERGAGGLAAPWPAHDTTRAVYEEYDAAFVRHWRDTAGEELSIRRPPPGSAGEAQAFPEGREREAVALAPVFEIDALRPPSLLPPVWERGPEHGGVPFRSTVVFLVRQGNPKSIRDWDGLLAPGVEVVAPDPAGSAGVPWTCLGAWAYALRRGDGDEARARDFVDRLYGSAAALEPTASDALRRFVADGVGDVLLVREDVAHRVARKNREQGFEIVTPSVSVLVEPQVAAIDRVVLSRRARELARAYVAFLYSPDGQEIAARHFLRPIDAAAAQRLAGTLLPLELLTVERMFGERHVARQAQRCE